MNIGEAARRSGLPAKTIRYYEDIGLVRALRDSNGYRAFLDADIHKLTFLSRARALGFSIQDCRNLLTLWEDQDRASSDVKRIASEHLDVIDQKVAELGDMRNSLSDLINSCAGDDRPDCPILKDLANAK